MKLVSVLKQSLYEVLSFSKGNQNGQRRKTPNLLRCSVTQQLECRLLLSTEVSSLAADIGVFRNGMWLFDREADGYTGENVSFNFGLSNDVAVSGDFVGNDGREETGVFRGGTWVIDINHNGFDVSDTVLQFGLATDIPVVGDVDNNPTNGDEIGVYRAGSWIFDWNHNGFDATDLTRTFQFGLASDQPFLAQLNGVGPDELCVFRNGTIIIDWNNNGNDASDLSGIRNFGRSGDRIVAGDLDGNGVDEISVFRRGDWYVDWNHNGYDVETAPDWQFGLSFDQPVAVAIFDTAPVSFELRDAPKASSPEKRVALWLRKNLALIEQAEFAFGVDRRAIAGVIAWEALVNPRSEIEFALSSALGSRGAPGPGKVHFKEGFIFEGNPVSKQVEGFEASRFYSQPQIEEKDWWTRRNYLSTKVGAITYIAAMFNAYSVHFERAGYHNVRWFPEILGNLHGGSKLLSKDSGDNLTKMEMVLRNEFPTIRTFNPDPMETGGWIHDHLGWLELLVGVPARRTPEDSVEEVYGTNLNDVIVIEENPFSGVVAIVNLKDRAAARIQYIPHPRFDLRVVADDGDDVIANLTSRTAKLFGGNGNDFLLGGDGSDSLFGEYGNDQLVSNDGGDDILWGYFGDDVYSVGLNASGKKEIWDLEGINTLDFGALSRSVNVDIGRGGRQRIADDSLVLSLSSGEAIDHVQGTRFDDVLIGNNLNNNLDGGAGNDTLDGKNGDDRLWGFWGSDTYRFVGRPTGTKTIWDLEDINTLDFQSMDVGVNVDIGRGGYQRIVGDSLALSLSSGEAIDHIQGTRFDDVLIGNNLNNEIRGGAGNDTLRGASGNDSLFGDRGSDSLFGGAGNDRLYGGPYFDWGTIDRLWGEEGDDYLDVRDDEPNDFLDDPSGNNILLGDWGAPSYFRKRTRGILFG